MREKGQVSTELRARKTRQETGGRNQSRSRREAGGRRELEMGTRSPGKPAKESASGEALGESGCEKHTRLGRHGQYWFGDERLVKGTEVRARLQVRPGTPGRSGWRWQPAHLRKSSRGRVEAGVPSAGQLRKWN